jgi:hypothetical protein
VTDTTIALGAIAPDADGAYPVDGQPVAMPVRVRSALMASATFFVEADRAARLIEPTGFAPQRRGDRAMVSVALVKYLDCDLGSYDELGLAFVVEQPPGQPALGRGAVATYIHRLPVSEAFTCEAGRGIWGFPKWVADLRVTIGAGVATATLGDELTVALRRGLLPVPSRPLTMACYSNDADGRVIRTEWTTTNRRMRLRVGGGSAKVDLTGEGPFADDLRALGFPRPPLLTMFAGEMRATFGPPVRI